ncbi:hypothetical protein CDAR_1181 [Caerostris darwini]|uniref:Uncharacterized protein n=1 Tax=Caerostris darwini TaxID=1538125 RepID=A0AAV4SLK8_9ARAC|nr:hypothetical protein CDAR_991 [Caerostris darwini]GIY35318.1 hypothetical protein CDAR_1181 [Caerostris darwini]
MYLDYLSSEKEQQIFLIAFLPTADASKTKRENKTCSAVGKGWNGLADSWLSFEIWVLSSKLAKASGDILEMVEEWMLLIGSGVVGAV